MAQLIDSIVRKNGHKNTQYESQSGFTLVELLVVISIIGILMAVVYATFGETRPQARDSVRQTTLKDMQLAVERYQNEYGRYPEQGCNVGEFAFPDSCANFIEGVTPDFISTLPSDAGYGYRVSENGDRYKILYQGVESRTVEDYEHPFARCPANMGESPCSSTVPPADEYAVYSLGAENW